MENKWTRKTIAECAADEPYSTQIGPFGKALTPEEYTSSGVPLLRGVNVNHGRFYDDGFVFISEETADRLSKFESYPGDVLLVHKGTLGQIGLMPKDRKYHRYIMGNSMLRVRCDTTKLIPEYLYYWLCSNEGQHYLFSRVSQVGVPQIQRPLTTLREASLPVPPLDEQKAIAHILGTLDDKIELNQQMNGTLEAISRAIFKSWFVDFDPVRAKMDGRQPTGMDATTADLFPDSFEDLPRGEIPKGWRVGKLSELAEVVMGSSPKGDTYNEDGIGIPLVNGPVEFGNYFLVKKKWTIAPTRLSISGDLIFCVRGSTTGRRVIADDVYCLGRGVCAIRAPQGQQSFINQTINLGLDRLLAKTTGSVFPNLNTLDIKEFEILLPPEMLIQKYCLLEYPLTKRVWHNIQESESLTTIRNSLLPRLLSGEIQVKEAEKLVEAVA
jgi:type I restriction enzyme S subunit